MAAGPMTPQRASVTAVAGVLAAVGLMLLLATWAATIGPQEVLRGEGDPPRSYDTLPPSSPTASPIAPPGSTRAAGGGDNDLLFTIAAIVAALLATIVVLAVVLSIIHWLLTRSWRRWEREPEPEEVAFDPLDAPAQLAAALVEDAAGQRELLTGGSPRNAIVACWHRFEERASQVGVHRRPWETSSEFTLRVLDRVSADTSAVTTLAELYRDARHSRHEITEANRVEALEALDVIYRSLTTRAGQT
jgi:hypothetical protein